MANANFRLRRALFTLHGIICATCTHFHIFGSGERHPTDPGTPERTGGQQEDSPAHMETRAAGRQTCRSGHAVLQQLLTILLTRAHPPDPSKRCASSQLRQATVIGSRTSTAHIPYRCRIPVEVLLDPEVPQILTNSSSALA